MWRAATGLLCNLRTPHLLISLARHTLPCTLFIVYPLSPFLALRTALAFRSPPPEPGAFVDAAVRHPFFGVPPRGPQLCPRPRTLSCERRIALTCSLQCITPAASRCPQVRSTRYSYAARAQLYITPLKYAVPLHVCNAHAC